MATHKQVPQLPPRLVQAVMQTITRKVNEGELDEDTAAAMRQSLIAAAVPPDEGTVTKTRIAQLDTDKRKRIERGQQRLAALHDQIMQDRRRQLLEMDDSEWDALVEEANNEQPTEAENE